MCTIQYSGALPARTDSAGKNNPGWPGFSERERIPSFVERALVLPGAAESLFPEDVRSLGARIAVESNGVLNQRRTPTTPLSIPALGEMPAPEGRTARSE